MQIKWLPKNSFFYQRFITVSSLAKTYFNVLICNRNRTESDIHSLLGRWRRATPAGGGELDRTVLRGHEGRPRRPRAPHVQGRHS